MLTITNQLLRKCDDVRLDGGQVPRRIKNGESIWFCCGQLQVALADARKKRMFLPFDAIRLAAIARSGHPHFDGRIQ